MVAMKNTALNVMAIAATASAYTPSLAGTKAGCFWSIPGVGNFNTNFNAVSSTFGTVQDILSSTYTVASGYAPFARRFDFANLGFSNDGSLTLTVPGGQKTGKSSSTAC